MKVLAHVLHGSKLYRLDSPASDTDFKSIHLPELSACALLRAERNLQRKIGEGAAKQEYESFALQEFLKLAANGEDVAITMLHCTDTDVYGSSPLWDLLRAQRAQFYTRRMRGSLGFAISQSTKYALRADRMEAVLKVIAALEKALAAGVERLHHCWDDLPDGEHIRRVTSLGRNSSDILIYEVAGKGLPATITPAYALEILTKVRDTYGERVRAARSMSGKDYKSLSHSFRVGYQLLHLYREGNFSYPLPESEFIRAVKVARLNYVDDHLDDQLNTLIAQVEQAAERSTYPEKVDLAWLDSLVLEAYGLKT